MGCTWVRSGQRQGPAFPIHAHTVGSDVRCCAHKCIALVFNKYWRELSFAGTCKDRKHRRDTILLPGQLYLPHQSMAALSAA